jgi:hypothetical protein
LVNVREPAMMSFMSTSLDVHFVNPVPVGFGRDQG